MTIVFNQQTQATLTGARDLNRVHRIFTKEDLGYKIETLISSMNNNNEIVSALVLAAVSASDSGVTWSAFSGFVTSTLPELSNFSDE